MWMLDVAREQSPTLDHLRRFLELTERSGYNAIGLYLEHRFAYPSTPWSRGQGSITPEMIATLESEFPDIQIIPFINLLGHFEGMLYTEDGKKYREETFKGLQACPSCPEFVDLCKSLIADTLSAFSSEIVHIGGDETWQLGACPKCKARIGQSGTEDGKALLYGEHFGPLAKDLVASGRRPGVWGDMFLDHPTALEAMPKETIIFDWQYFKSPLPTTQGFIAQGFDTVCCPAIQTYNAIWCHVAESEHNVKESIEAATTAGAMGVCVTTWECGLFGNYETLIPIIAGCGDLLAGNQAPLMKAFEDESPEHGEWARLMSADLAKLGGIFAPGTIRSAIKCRLLLYSNPFLTWMHHAEELCGEIGDKALAILDQAIAVAPNASMRGVAEFGKLAIEFVRYADQARQAYAQRLPGLAIAALTPCRQIFEQLEKIARAAHLNIGGSTADIERSRAAKEHVERVILRIKQYGDGHLGYLPAFEILTHPKFMPHDQASWWLINKWANE